MLYIPYKFDFWYWVYTTPELILMQLEVERLMRGIK